MAAVDIVCLGEPLFELSHVASGQWRSGIGGDVSNVAVAAARQGTRSAVVSQLGDDQLGADVRDFWRKEGVDDTFVRTLPDTQTGLYLITHKNGEHYFDYRRAGSAASLMRPDDLQDVAFENVSIVHLSGISQAISRTACAATGAAIEKARCHGAKVSYDPNLRLGLWPLATAQRVTHETIKQVDILLPGLDDARLLTGIAAPEDIIRHFASLGPSVVAMTMGKDGVLVLHDDELRHVEAPRVDAVDASGAGDCFDGTFLSELVKGADVFEAARFAATAAALSVQGHGAASSIPNRDAVLSLLQRTQKTR